MDSLFSVLTFYELRGSLNYNGLAVLFLWKMSKSKQGMMK